MAFFGDGTTNIGAFHEAVNLAAVWKLPVVFVCENNLYMEYTPIRSVTAVEHPAADRAGGLRPARRSSSTATTSMPSTAPRSQCWHGRATATGRRIVECKTYRHSGHSRADPAKYRPPEELAAWLERDPLPTYRAAAWLGPALPRRRWPRSSTTAMAQVDQATETCKASPPPALATAFTDLWADGGTAWRN